MTTESELEGAENSDLFWLFHDAFGLFHLERKPAALLLLLCAVDALAARALPEVPERDGERFKRYLGERLPKYAKAAHFDVRVRGQNQTLRIEAVLHNYLRNPVVHEGLRLDMEKVSGVAVHIDWADEARYLRWSDREGRLIIGADWLVDIVGGVVKDATSLPGAATGQQGAPQAQGAERHG